MSSNKRIYLYFAIPIFSVALLAFILPKKNAHAPDESPSVYNTIAEIDSLDKWIQIKLDSAKPLQFLVDTSLWAGPPSWQEFPVSEANKEETTTAEYSSRALVFKIDSFYVISLVLQPGSYDWEQDAMYLYRPDRTLAKLTDELNTYHGYIDRNRVLYFDTKGKKLSDRTNYADINTKKRVKKPNEEFADESVYIYKTVSALPFYRLLRIK